MTSMTNHRYTLFYQPANAWVGDCMPCWHDGELYLYYQSDRRQPEPFPNCEPFGWSLARTHDLLHYDDHGKVLANGPAGSRDEWLYAGSVIHAEGRLWAFYTARCHAFWDTDTPAELVGIATSDDGVEWVKHPEWMLPKEPGFELNFFRDPVVHRDEANNRWILVASQRHTDGPLKRRGCLTWHTSEDLIHWEFQGVLWSPGMFYMLEMPDLFQWGDWWYLLFSEYSTGNRTRYRMSRSLDGPWLAPPDDSFDGRCLYAARTYATDDDTRHLVGWLATRQNDDDTQPWVWGGSAVVHQLRQGAGGVLSLHLPEAQNRLFTAPVAGIAPTVSLAAVDGRDEAVLRERAGEFYRLDFTASFSAGTHAFGVKLRESSESDDGYAFQFSPPRGAVVFDRLPNYPWFRCQNRDLYRPVALEAGTEHRVTVIVDRDICLLYVDGVALSARMSDRPGGELKLYVHGGALNVRDIRYYDGVTAVSEVR